MITSGLCAIRDFIRFSHLKGLLAMLLAAALTSFGSLLPVQAGSDFQLRHLRNDCSTIGRLPDMEAVAWCVRYITVHDVAVDDRYYVTHDEEYRTYLRNCRETYPDSRPSRIDCEANYLDYERVEHLFDQVVRFSIEGRTCQEVNRTLASHFDRLDRQPQFRQQIIEQGCASVAKLYVHLIGQPPYWSQCRGLRDEESFAQCLPEMSEDQFEIALQQCFSDPEVLTPGMIMANENVFLSEADRDQSSQASNSWPAFECDILSSLVGKDAMAINESAL